MGTPVGARDNPQRWKPANLQNYLTVGQLAEKVKRSTAAIRRAERIGAIPSPARFKVGRLRVRLYSPEEVDTIVEYFKTTRPGPKRREAI